MVYILYVAGNHDVKDLIIIVRRAVLAKAEVNVSAMDT